MYNQGSHKKKETSFRQDSSAIKIENDGFQGFNWLLFSV